MGLCVRTVNIEPVTKPSLTLLIITERFVALLEQQMSNSFPNKIYDAKIFDHGYTCMANLLQQTFLGFCKRLKGTVKQRLKNDGYENHL